MENIVKRLLNRDRRTLVRMVTLIKNEIPSTCHFLVELHEQTSHAHIVDVIGAPDMAKVPLSRILGENWAAATARSA